MSTRSAIAWSLAVGHTLGTQGAKVSGRRSARRLEGIRAPLSGMAEALDFLTYWSVGLFREYQAKKRDRENEYLFCITACFCFFCGLVQATTSNVFACSCTIHLLLLMHVTFHGAFVVSMHCSNPSLHSAPLLPSPGTDMPRTYPSRSIG